jgi:Xaa-Pro aminopeptidase
MATRRTASRTAARDRLAALREALERHRLDALLVSRPADVAYLSGFEGAGLLLCIRTRQHLITDGRFETQAPREAPDFHLVLTKSGYNEAIAKTIRRSRAKRVGFEADHLTVGQYEDIRSRVGGTRLVSTRQIVGALRQVKDAGEIAALRRSVAISDRAFRRIRRFVRPGRTERQISVELQRLLQAEGADRMAFEPIVASGPNAALPHAPITGRKVRDRDMVKLDFGAQRDGYCSDLTRMVFVGRPTPKQRRVYRAVLEAQRRAEGIVRPGVKAGEVDAAARDYLRSVGLADYFKHSLGHGVGRDVHEAPGLSSKSETELQAGMVMTIEPGVYIEGWGGVRMEDMVLVTNDGCEVLTQAPKVRV